MVVRVARTQGLKAALAMTPPQAETYLHFADALELQDELTAIQTARLAQADAKILKKHIKSVTP